jgi:two-component system NarL family sensor kinase
VETAAFRITQEALANVAKHTHATNVRVAIDADHIALRVRVVDNGPGLPRPRNGDSSNGNGVGLVSMRHRAEALKGTLTLHSDSGGTTVTALLPLQPS